MEDLPVGSIPYQSAVNENTDSLCKILKNKGYSTMALHMYFASGWNREYAYPWLGFDEMHFYDEYEDENIEFFRAYPSDKVSYEKVIELYEQDENDKKFIFNVTMQDHGGYTFKCSEDITINMNGDYPLTEQYLTTLHNSDAALEVLISYFQQIQEPTVILLFGDHQPAIEQEFLEELYGKKIEDLSLEEKQREYIVPFMIWANYDIEEREFEKISANYLSTLLMETAGIELPQYNKFLNNLYFEYPVINVNGIINSFGENKELEDAETEEKMNMYREI